MKQAKILWGEGLFLRPQHFQQQDAYHESLVSDALLTAQPFGWGVRHLVVDNDALRGGILRIDHIDAVLPDGESYIAPDRDLLPPPVALDEIVGDESTEFRLALHQMRQHGGNSVPEDNEQEQRRYVVSHQNSADLFTDAAEAEIPVLKKAARLKPADDPLDQYVSMALLRVRKTPASGFELDTAYMPPTLSIGAAPMIMLQLRRLLDALQAKVNALYGFHREPSKNIIEFRSGDIASFWLLHTISSAVASLAHLHQNPVLHPERLFQEQLRLAGGLLTFSKTYSLADLPTYDHAHPGSGFLKLDQILRDLLDTVISTRYFRIALTETKPAFHAGRLDSEKINDKTAFYLGVSAAQPLPKLIESVPVRMKIGAPDDVEKLVLSAMHGVKLVHAAQVPPAIPVRPGACYFSLDPRSPLYERMLQAQSVTIYAPEGFDDLSLELIAVNA
ncbi:type VI secretion system baseplate subunit TssK [Thiosocius teredinicola]|uniref:type VI secretion system baseplate subunit TssK n=1 Tax=Thiosocius teredinicola TaxID=1973002 RepID=UPI000990AD1D